MFCPNCGKQLKENAKFCGACGIKIQERGFVSKDEKKFKRVTVSSGDAAQTSLPSLQQGEKNGAIAKPRSSRKIVWISAAALMLLAALVGWALHTGRQKGSGMEKPEIGSADLARFKTIFYSQFSADDKAVIADVTHDGVSDMIVIAQEDEGMYECILYIGSETNEMKEINLDRGGESHVGGFFNLYIRQTEDGFSNLGKQHYNMWQGYGSLSFEEYYLDSDGKEISVNIVSVSSPSNEIPVSDEDMDWYNDALKKAKENGAFYTIIETESGEPTCPVLETDPAVVFSKQ